MRGRPAEGGLDRFDSQLLGRVAQRSHIIVLVPVLHASGGAWGQSVRSRALDAV